MTLDAHKLAALPYGGAREAIRAHEDAQRPTYNYRVSLLVEAKDPEHARQAFADTFGAECIHDLVDAKALKVRRVRRKP